MIKHIAKCIEDKLGAGWTIGTNIFVGWRPLTAIDRCLLIQEFGGKADFITPDFMEILIQLVNRGKTYNNARDDAWDAFNVLHGYGCCSGWPVIAGSAYNNYMAMEIEALASPQYIGQDEKGRFEYSTNYIWRLENPT